MHCAMASSNVIWFALAVIANALVLSRSSLGSMPSNTFRRNSPLNARASANLRVRVEPSPSSLRLRVVGLVYLKTHERVTLASKVVT